MQVYCSGKFGLNPMRIPVDMDTKADVEAFFEVFCNEEDIQLVDDNCCRTITYTLGCKECREDSVLIEVFEDQENKTCACEGIYFRASNLGLV